MYSNIQMASQDVNFLEGYEHKVFLNLYNSGFKFASSLFVHSAHSIYHSVSGYIFFIWELIGSALAYNMYGLVKIFFLFRIKLLLLNKDFYILDKKFYIK